MRHISKHHELFNFLVGDLEKCKESIQVRKGIADLADFIIYDYCFAEEGGYADRSAIACLTEKYDHDGDAHNSSLFYLMLLLSKKGKKVRKPVPIIRFVMKVLDLVCEHDRIDLSCAVHLLIMQLKLLENGYVEYFDLESAKEIRSTSRFEGKYKAKVRVKIPWPQYPTKIEADCSDFDVERGEPEDKSEI